MTAVLRDIYDKMRRDANAPLNIVKYILATLLVGGLVAYAAIPDAPTITGSAQVIDGDTLRIRDQRIRLWGIDAPERSQPQGPAATAYLTRIITSDVSCYKKEMDKYGRIVAQCFVDRTDIGRRLVANGHALDYTQYSKGYYRDEEQAAKDERLGMWADKFVIPEKWRHK